jgi:hypothetical protein
LELDLTDFLSVVAQGRAARKPGSSDALLAA